jgi:NADH dehydrogenase (ubiquinone) 1 alpha subcomplex subunit 9
MLKTIGKKLPVASGPGGRSSVSPHIVTVFGCTGFLGRYLVNELGKQGTQTVLPYRGSQEDTRHLKPMGDLGQLVPLRFDGRDLDSLTDCIGDSDVVYNLIGREYETRNFSFDDLNKIAGNIAKVSKKLGVEKLIHVSALNAGNEKSRILKSKKKGEEIVLSEFPNATIVRPSEMYGYEDRLLQYLGKTVTHIVKRYMTAGFIPLVNGGERKMRPVYVGDVAKGLARMMDVKGGGGNVYELVGPDEMTFRDFVKLFCEYTHRPFNPVNVPYSLFRSITSITQLSPLSRKNVHHVDLQTIDDSLTSGSLGFKDLGMDERHLKELLIRFVRHYRSEEWAHHPASIDEGSWK